MDMGGRNERDGTAAQLSSSLSGTRLFAGGRRVSCCMEEDANTKAGRMHTPHATHPSSTTTPGPGDQQAACARVRVLAVVGSLDRSLSHSLYSSVLA